MLCCAASPVKQIDGFRFDIMGHHFIGNMAAVRTALDRLTPEADGVDGRHIYLYGEAWDFGEVALNQRGRNASQHNLVSRGGRGRKVGACVKASVMVSREGGSTCVGGCGHPHGGVVPDVRLFDTCVPCRALCHVCCAVLCLQGGSRLGAFNDR